MYAYVYDIGSDQDQETSFLFNVKKAITITQSCIGLKLILDARSLAASPLIDIVAPIISFRKINLKIKF